MNSMVDSLFDQYDRGRVTRRHLVQALAALVLPTPTLAQDGARTSGPIVRGLSVNHVALTVSDVPRSFAFYERLFGVTKGWPATDAGTGIQMDLPAGSLTIDVIDNFGRVNGHECRSGGPVSRCPSAASMAGQRKRQDISKQGAGQSRPVPQACVTCTIDQP